ncbi:uncharacterized protein FMAN_15454 [Fusarium mangiferae]|uniref:Uncharacterized protein n=1 Tax=Fusarium mangiferae TaxID=192010 RepID=A0A1L7UJ14_FUSMA|nr:uncharacterized protein FMAN_15454 [Fusarium mangiferae]CVL09212.1 uncharacterized protein FMAN_15454 [Fusarium mangiferae]
MPNKNNKTSGNSTADRKPSAQKAAAANKNKRLTEAEMVKALAECDAQFAKMTQEELEAKLPEYKNYQPKAADADGVYAWLMDEYGSISGGVG